MKNYVKKPVVIQALQFTTANETEIVQLVEDNSKVLFISKIGILTVNTLEGVMKADFNDWIIKGIQGEYYFCKPDIFEATYKECD